MTQTKPERWTYIHKQTTKPKKVKFYDDERQKLEMCHNFITQLSPNPKEDVEYTPKLAMVISHVMRNINKKKMAEGESFGQQYILQKGLKKFGDRGSKAATKDMDQLQQINCFTPIDVAELTPQEKRKAMEYLMFLNKKRDKPIKVRMVYNGKQNQ